VCFDNSVGHRGAATGTVADGEDVPAVQADSHPAFVVVTVGEAVTPVCVVKTERTPPGPGVAAERVLDPDVVVGLSVPEQVVVPPAEVDCAGAAVADDVHPALCKQRTRLAESSVVPVGVTVGA